MPFCCGKDRECNFCPECGKAMSKEAGLKGLLRYVTAQMEAAVKREDQAKRESSDYERRAAGSPDYLPYRDAVKGARRKLAAAKKKVETWKDWQECLIKAIDGP